MTMDDAIVVQRDAFHAALAPILEADGLKVPPCFRVDPRASGSANVYMAGGPHAYDISYLEIEHAWSVRDIGHVRPEVLDRIVECAHRAIRRAAQAHEIQCMPSWAVLVHPVLLAAMLAHEPDRSRMPVRGETCREVPGGRWDISEEDGSVHHEGTIGIATGDVWLAKGFMQAASFGCLMRMGEAIASVTMCSIPHPDMPEIGATSIAIPVIPPETILTSLAGRCLGEVLQLPSTGAPDVERAAADCIISGYKALNNGIDIQFEPTRLIPYGVAPTPDLARAMRLAPLIG